VSTLRVLRLQLKKDGESWKARDSDFHTRAVPIYLALDRSLQSFLERVESVIERRKTAGTEGQIWSRSRESEAERARNEDHRDDVSIFASSNTSTDAASLLPPQLGKHHAVNLAVSQLRVGSCESAHASITKSSRCSNQFLGLSLFRLNLAATPFLPNRHDQATPCVYHPF
jgi:hypothetical protein